MQKPDAEKGIRYLSTQWVDQLPPEQREHPSFTAFTTWLRSERRDHYLDFQSTTNARDDAERWFNSELRQAWRD